MNDPEFNEDVFVRALMERPEDAKRFASTFKAEWLRKAELSPVLHEIFIFVKKHGLAPSLNTLNKVFVDKDKELYELRYKGVLEQLATVSYDPSNAVYTLDRARDFAIVRSFQSITNETAFLELQSDLRGSTMLELLTKWQQQFTDGATDRTMNLKEATDHLVQSHGFVNEIGPIACGIKPIDEWCNGGLRPRNLGIVLAGTGHGKSVVLMNQAFKIATIAEKKVWFITNELMLEEATERFLSRVTGKSMRQIIEDPGIVYGPALGAHWHRRLHDRLWITEMNREVSVDDIEGEMARLSTLHGWKPDVIVLDYMERMRPILSGFKRDSTWSWLGAIAQDLCRLAKRHGILVWTASQSNRAGLGATELSMEHAQGSIKHLQEAACVVSMIQEPHPDTTRNDVVVMKFKALKMRQSRRGNDTVCLEANLDAMNITGNEVEMPTVKTDDAEEEVDTRVGMKRKPKRRRV